MQRSSPRESLPVYDARHCARSAGVLCDTGVVADEQPEPQAGDVRLTEDDEIEVFDGLVWSALRSIRAEEPDLPIRHDDSQWPSTKD